MHFTHLIVLAGLATSSLAASRANHVVHEKRDSAPHGWVTRGILDAKSSIPMRVGLKQTALHRAEEFLHEVSDPKSPRYGKHWTAQEVAEMFAPR